jgi:hypothetical protein
VFLFVPVQHVPLAPDLLAAISDGDPQRDIPSYLTESSMLNWHSDLWAGEETSPASFLEALWLIINHR